ncbi:variable large family protein, partial [Borrelia sp. A-FGy1]|uniref:variable large family protein n=1 Tax=Borrelia sp. A-FGy1 TaxID=2608247 RepID=UPI0015F4404B
NAKAAAVTGGIALRSLLKNGKLAHKNDAKTAAQAVGLNASGKLLATANSKGRSVKSGSEKVTA